jgi:NADPH oxidase 2
VKCISHFEWHPFTITSSPNEPYLTVHMRLCGDWTKNLAKLIQSSSPIDKKLENEKMKKPSLLCNRISFDGPYGTCAEDIFKYKEVMLIGAGIGVTPYASILKHIYDMAKRDKDSIEIKKVRFYWICQS